MTDRFDGLPEPRRRGLEKMEEVYGWELDDGPGDFFRCTADHLFAEIRADGAAVTATPPFSELGCYGLAGLTDSPRKLLGTGEPSQEPPRIPQFPGRGDRYPRSPPAPHPV
jgi:hypothetical protein